MRTPILRGGRSSAALEAFALALLVSASPFSIDAALAQQNAAAQETQRSYSIPAGSLSSALVAFGQQSGVQVSYVPSVAAGLSSGGLTGTMSADTALTRLLSGSGLSFQMTGANTAVISSADASSAGTTVDGAIALDTIDVSGGQASAGASDLPYETAGSINVISEQDINRLPGSTAGDIFKGTPGVIAGMNRNGAAIDVNIRGMQGMNRVATTVDGSDSSTSTWRGYAGVDNRTYVDPDLIGSVVVSKGPNDANPGAIGGTVAMETLSASDILKDGDTHGIRVRGTLSNNTLSPEIGRSVERSGDEPLFGTKSGSLAAAFTGENVDFVAAVARRKSGNYFAGMNGKETYIDYQGNVAQLSPTKHGEEVFNTSQDVTSYLLKSTIRIDEDQQLKLSYTRYQNTFGEVTPLIMQPNNGLERQVPLSEIEVDRLSARYSWNPVDNDFFNLKINAAMANTKEDAIYSVYIDSFKMFTETRNYNVDVSNTSRFDIADTALTLQYGGSYALEDAAERRRQESILSPTPNISQLLWPAQGTREIWSAYLNATWKPTDYLSLDAGMRYLGYDVNNRGEVPSRVYSPLYPPYSGYEGDGWTPSAGITLTPQEGWQVFAKYTEGLRAPSLREGTFTSSALVFNPDLTAERAKNWELGTNLMLNDVLREGDAARLKFVYFDNTTDDYIGRRSSNGSVLSVFNYDKIEMKGVEFSGEYDTERFFAQVGATYYTDFTSCPTAGNCVDYTLQSDYLANQMPPEYTLTGTFGARFFDGNLTLGTRVSHNAKRLAPLVPDPTYLFNTAVWNPYTLVDLFGQWKFSDDVTFDVSVENLFDRYYVDALNNSPLPSPGRTFRAAFTAKLGSSEPLDARWPLDAFNWPERAPGWTGLYVGAHMGHAWSSDRRNAASLTDFTDNGEAHDEFTANAIAGGQIGYNYELPNRAVFGIEGDFSWLDFQNSSQSNATGGIYIRDGQPAAQLASSLQWLATLRGRVGFSITDSLMIYGTGGAAFMGQQEQRTQFQITNQYDQLTIPAFTEVTAKTRVGWTLGAGAEFQIGGGWSMKGEYLYTNFGSQKFNFADARKDVGVDSTERVLVGYRDIYHPVTGQYIITVPVYENRAIAGDYSTVVGSSVKSEIELHSVKLGLNYRF